VDVVRDAIGESAERNHDSDQTAADDRLLWYSLGRREYKGGAGPGRSGALAASQTPESSGKSEQASSATDSTGSATTTGPETADAKTSRADVNQLLAEVGRAHSDGGTDTGPDASDGGKHSPIGQIATSQNRGEFESNGTSPSEWRFGRAGTDDESDSASAYTAKAPDETMGADTSSTADPSAGPDESAGTESDEQRTIDPASPDLRELSDEELVAFATGLDDTPEGRPAPTPPGGASDTETNASDTGPAETARASEGDGETAPRPDEATETEVSGGQQTEPAGPTLERPPETSPRQWAPSNERVTDQASSQPAPEVADQEPAASESQAREEKEAAPTPDTRAFDANPPDSDASAPEVPLLDEPESAEPDAESQAASSGHKPAIESETESDTVQPSATDEFASPTAGVDDLSPPGATEADAAAEETESEEAASPGSFGDFESTTEYERPERLELSPGTSVLVQCGSQDDRRQAACLDLLDPEHVGGRQVLLIRYRQMDQARLERIVTNAERVKLVSIGYTQPIPPAIQDAVSTVKINNPNDLTRLGIVVTATVDDWETSESGIVACVDPLDAVMQYKGVESLFRFLHLFLGKLHNSGVISHIHVDPSAGEPQKINVFKPLFDAVLTIDSVGTHLESG
jgi:hypothetical protein